MVNFVAVQKLLLHRLMKWAGLTPQMIEIDPMTVMNMWVPLSKTKAEDKNEEKGKPAVVLIHDFAADGVMTWEFQVGSLAKKYAVYVPDLIFFGASTIDGSDRSPAFQAEMVVRALGKFGVQRCAVVGFSYGGMVAIKMAELWPEMVRSLVVSGSVLALTESISETLLERIGFSSWSEMLLPNSVKGLKAMFSIACYKKLWFPDILFTLQRFSGSIQTDCRRPDASRTRFGPLDPNSGPDASTFRLSVRDYLHVSFHANPDLVLSRALWVKPDCHHGPLIC